MVDAANAMAKVVQLNGRRLVGKTRLQKTLYFLEELEVGFGLGFDYYHYGPYSEELSIATDDAQALSLIDIDWKVTSAGTKYAVFSSKKEQYEDELDSRRQKILKYLSEYDAITLEIAATADYLSKNGFPDRKWEETRRRKPEKTTEERAGKAEELLQQLYSL